MVVFGSINIDGVVSTAQFPRAGQTRIGAAYATFAGGKGANQAVAAARYGSEVIMAGCVGADTHGDQALAALTAAGVGIDLVQRSATPTAYASVWVDDAGENQIVVASGANLELEAAHIPGAVFRPEATFVLQLEVPARESASVATRAKAAGARVVLNAAPFEPITPGFLRHIDVLVVNEIEAGDLATDLKIGDDSELAAARSLAARFALTCVVTRGVAGAVAFEGSGTTHRVPALDIEPVDTTGAGDTFVGCLAAALEQGQTLRAALRAGCAAAGLACLKLGAQSGIPRRSDIDRRLLELPH